MGGGAVGTLGGTGVEGGSMSDGERTRKRNDGKMRSEADAKRPRLEEGRTQARVTRNAGCDEVDPAQSSKPSRGTLSSGYEKGSCQKSTSGSEHLAGGRAGQTFSGLTPGADEGRSLSANPVKSEKKGECELDSCPIPALCIDHAKTLHEQKRCVLAKPPHINKMVVKRCGPILDEVPELGRMFKPEARDATGQWLHACAACSYSTHNKTTLLYHVIGLHLGITPFLCTQGCGFASGSYSNLRQHEMRVHKVPYNRYSTTELDYHLCFGCGYRFRAPLTLLQHYLKAHQQPSGYKSPASDDDPDARGRSNSQAEVDEQLRKQRMKEVMSLSNITHTQLR